MESLDIFINGKFIASKSVRKSKTAEAICCNPIDAKLGVGCCLHSFSLVAQCTYCEQAAGAPPISESMHFFLLPAFTPFLQVHVEEAMRPFVRLCAA